MSWIFSSLDHVGSRIPDAGWTTRATLAPPHPQLRSKELSMDRQSSHAAALTMVLLAAGCSQPSPETALAADGGGQTRTYYIAADELEWDYAPTGTNLSEGRPFNE